MQTSDKGRSLVENALAANGLAVVAVSSDGRFIDLDARFAAWLGRPVDALVGTPIWEHVLGGSPIWWAALHRGLEYEQRVGLRLRGPNGPLAVTCRALPATDAEHGAYVALVTEIVDTTDSERRVRDRRLEYLLDAAEHGLWEWRLDTNEIYLSPSWLRLMGYADRPVPASPIDAWVHPDDAPAVLAAFGQLQRGEVDTLSHELRMRRADGHYVWMMSRVRIAEWGPDGRPQRMIGLQLDVTDRHEARAQVEESERRLQQIVDNLPIGVALIGADGRVLFANAACGRLSGLTGDALLGLHPEAMPWTIYDDAGRRVDFPDHPAFAPWLTGEPVHGLVLAHYLTTRAPDSEPVWTVSDFVPRQGPDGKLADILCTFADITLLRRTRAILQRTQRFESVARLAGRVAHDFNNLLGAVMGSAEVIEMVLGPDVEVAEDVQRIREAARRGGALTRQLAACARQRELSVRIVDLRRVLDAAAPTLASLLGRHINLETDPGDRPLRVVIDPAEFEQVLQNLALHARDAMPDGGAVRIELSARVDDNPPGAVTVRVVHGGRTIPPTELPHIFEPFATDGPDDHLRLAACAGIARQHGGHIRATSPADGPTTFVVELPRVRITHPTAPPPGPVPDGGWLLYVEPDPQLRLMGQRALEPLGHPVEAMASVAEARNALAEHGRPAAVVMPAGETGRALVQAVDGAPMLFTVTGHDQGAEALWADADVLLRPFGPQELRGRVRALMMHRTGRPSPRRRKTSGA